MIESSLIVSVTLNLTSSSLMVEYDTGRTYKVDFAFMKNKMRVADISDVNHVEVGMNGSEIILHTSTGEERFPWDFILCYFEPEYKYFCGDACSKTVVS